MSKRYATETNSVKLTGIIDSAPTYSHTVFDEEFYNAFISIGRDRSENKDLVPITVSEKLINCKELEAGTTVTITGQFRSFNKFDKESGKRHLILSVFCKDIEVVDPAEVEYENEIDLTGYICKDPTFRKTPKGREISDILLAVNRAYGKADYIPCIAWGRNARYANNMEVGTHVSIHGRIQSRTYSKKIAENEFEERVVYEVSIATIKPIVEEVEPEVEEETLLDNLD